MASRLVAAIEQIKGARLYTLQLLKSVGGQDWFRQPTEGVSHIGWQATHLAVAEHRLCLERVCGLPESDSVMPPSLMARFGRDSVPDPDPQHNPSPDEIRSFLDRVHERTLSELATLSDDELDKPAGKPHPVFSTKIGALHWCAMHEMLHAGQIGLLRRLLGHPPLW